MTKEQFSEAVRIADSEESLLDVDIDVLYGCGLRDFKPVSTTLRVVAAHVRWQAKMLNGEWDSVELDACRDIMRRKVTII